MSQQDSFQERTEQATPKRRLDARRKGNVARSRELTTMVVMLSGSSLLVMFGHAFGARIVGLFQQTLSLPRERLLDVGYMVYHFTGSAQTMLQTLAPLFLVLVVAALLSSVALGGWSFSVQALGFKFERISIPKGLKRIFSVRGLVELSKALAKFSLIAVAGIYWMRFMADELMGLSYESIEVALLHAGAICMKSLLILSTTLILIAGADVPFQLWHHSKNLKMTRQEVRDEQKDTDGRPEVKSRIRMLQQQQATRRMMEAVPDASVVITNPTHFAVALKYDSEKMSAPVVVAKGKDLIAERIRNIAIENDVMLFSAPPLARVLFRSTKIGQQIPYELYRAVAQVLAYVFQLKDRTHFGGDDLQVPDITVDESAYSDSTANDENQE